MEPPAPLDLGALSGPIRADAAERAVRLGRYASPHSKGAEHDAWLDRHARLAAFAADNALELVPTADWPSSHSPRGILARQRSEQVLVGDGVEISVQRTWLEDPAQPPLVVGSLRLDWGGSHGMGFLAKIGSDGSVRPQRWWALAVAELDRRWWRYWITSTRTWGGWLAGVVDPIGPTRDMPPFAPAMPFGLAELLDEIDLPLAIEIGGGRLSILVEGGWDLLDPATQRMIHAIRSLVADRLASGRHLRPGTAASAGLPTMDPVAVEVWPGDDRMPEGVTWRDRGPQPPKER